VSSVESRNRTGESSHTTAQAQVRPDYGEKLAAIDGPGILLWLAWRIIKILAIVIWFVLVAIARMVRWCSGRFYCAVTGRTWMHQMRSVRENRRGDNRCH